MYTKEHPNLSENNFINYVPKQKNVIGRTFPANLLKLKMSQGQSLPDPDPQLINAKSLNFTKPKHFFKNIRRYAATSTSRYLSTSPRSWKQSYAMLLDKHEEPFKSIAETTIVSLLTILASIDLNYLWPSALPLQSWL
jgi:hypothetical protein